MIVTLLVSLPCTCTSTDSPEYLLLTAGHSLCISHSWCLFFSDDHPLTFILFCSVFFALPSQSHSPLHSHFQSMSLFVFLSKCVLPWGYERPCPLDCVLQTLIFLLLLPSLSSLLGLVHGTFFLFPQVLYSSVCLSSSQFLVVLVCFFFTLTVRSWQLDNKKSSNNGCKTRTDKSSFGHLSSTSLHFVLLFKDTVAWLYNNKSLAHKRDKNHSL